MSTSDRYVLIRFKEYDELYQLIGELSKKLGSSKASIARSALFEYCKKTLGGENGGKPADNWSWGSSKWFTSHKRGTWAVNSKI